MIRALRRPNKEELFSGLDSALTGQATRNISINPAKVVKHLIKRIFHRKVDLRYVVLR